MAFRYAVLVVIISLLAACSPQAAPTATPSPTDTPVPLAGKIILSDIGNDPATIIQGTQPLADYLAAHLSQFGIGIGEVNVTSDIPSEANALKNGQADLYFDSPYPALAVSDLSGGQPILRRWRNGVFEYHSVIFIRGGSGALTSINDLKGKIIAFQDPESTSGFMLPMAYLIQAGLKPVEKSSVTDTVAADEVGYVFSAADDNTIDWVLSGTVAAGATDNVSYDGISADTRAGLSILAETDSVPRQVVVARPGIDPALLDAIKALLIGLDQTPEGPAIMQSFARTTKFDEFPEGAEAALAHMRDLYNLVKNN